MEKFIDLIRVIIKNFNIHNNPEFDVIIKKILSKYLIIITLIEMINIFIVLIIYIKSMIFLDIIL